MFSYRFIVIASALLVGCGGSVPPKPTVETSSPAVKADLAKQHQERNAKSETDSKPAEAPK